MERDQPIRTLGELAAAIRARGMRVPAVFMLELCKPLTGVARELYACSESIQRVIFGRIPAPVLSEVLSSSERVEELIQLLELTSNDEARA
jgi:hypothetical protein